MTTTTQNKKVNVRSKEMLARLLATENLTIVHKKTNTAAFDMKNRVLVLPALENMSSNMYSGFIGHEVGHALFTDSNFDKRVERISNETNVPGAAEKIQMIYNIVEDARIEKLMKRKFHGLNSVFSSFYKEFVDSNEDFKEIIEYIKTDDSKETFLDRLNGELKVGANHSFPFSKNEVNFLERVRSSETSEDVSKIVNDIVTYLEIQDPPKNSGGQGGGQQNDQQNQDNGDDSDDSSGSGSSSKSDKSNESDDSRGGSGSSSQDNQKNNSSGNNQNESDDSDDSQNGDNDEESDSNDSQSGQQDKNSQNDAQEDDSSQKKQSKSQEGQQQEDNQDTPQQSGNKPSGYEQGALQKALGKAQIAAIEASNKGPEVHNLFVPKTNLENIVVPYKEAYSDIKGITADSKKYSAFVSANKKSIAHMVQEFEQRKAADDYRRTQTSDSGSLDMHKLSKYRVSDDIFKRVETVKEGKNHGLVMVIDWSGSMSGARVQGAVRQALIISEFCRKANIKFEVYTFVSGNKQQVNNNGFIKKPDMFDYDLGSFKMVNVLSHKMKNMEYRNNAAMLMSIADAGGLSNNNWMLYGTPLNSSIIATIDIVDEFKKTQKIDKVHAIFLTDGASELMQCIYNENRVRTYMNIVPNKSIVYTSSRRHGKRVKAVYDNSSKNFYNGVSMMQTRSLLEILQESTDCNAIGFFVSGDNEVPSELSKTLFKKEVDEYKKNGYTILENEGYKQLYIMSSAMIKSDTVHTDNAIQDIQANRKSKFLLTEFIKQIA